MKMKSPINWFGGKYYMATDIINLFPEHKVYVEGFGGAAHILFKKQPSQVEIYNDLHSGLYLLFKLLRENNQELISKIQLTPYSREEFYADDDWQSETDVIEKVRKFYVKTMQAVGTAGGGWSYSKQISRRGMCQSVSRWLGNIDENMPNLIERLREIQIENLDIVSLIEKYDSKNTLFYLDPPYISDTRVSKTVYKHEMTNDKHSEMVKKLCEIQAKVVLSGYEHKIYKPLEDFGWNKKLLGSFVKRSSKTNDGNIPYGKEFVWTNF